MFRTAFNWLRRPLTLLAALVVAGAAAAQGFPERPIKIIVPYSSGSTTDIIAA